MSDEAAFLSAIEAAPADALPRLVYADWLEERGDSRAEFIRLQQQLADVLARLQHVRAGLDAKWVQAIEIRRDVVIHSVEADRRPVIVKLIRLHSGYSLEQARDVLACLPSAVLKDLPLERAERIRQELAAYSTVTIEAPTTN
jgi:uncharacterized protein (TIGR02996 family)